MGNRILKDTIRINRRIDALSYFEEVVFYRLITAADDFGVYSANPVMLARTLFPLPPKRSACMQSPIRYRISAKASPMKTVISNFPVWRTGFIWLSVIRCKRG